MKVSIGGAKMKTRKPKLGLMESLIAWERAKKACEPEAIKARAEEKCREIFGEPDEIQAWVAAKCQEIFSEMEGELR